MRIGLFGGTFNPIHYGHLRAAKEVCEGFDLQTLYFIPSALPPHKDTQDVASAADRLEMTRIAVSGDPEFIPSDVELKRPGLSYTIDTVKYFKKSLNIKTDLFLVMGIDAFLEIDTWKSYADLLQIIPFIVIARPDPKWQDASRQRQVLEEFLKRRISGGYNFSSSRLGFFHADKQPIFISKLSLLDISSSTIRELIKAGRSIQSFVPPKVESYIKSKGLYI